MPKDLNSTFVLEKNKKLVKITRLYTIEDYDGLGNDKNVCEYSQNITFDGIEYEAIDIHFGGATEKSSGEIDEANIVVGNPLRYWSAILRAYDLRKKKVTITYVAIDHLDDPAVKYQEIFYIKKWSINQKTVTFYLNNLSDILRIKLPLRVVIATHCEYPEFRGDECGYAGAEITCNRTLQRCRELNNVERYGGCPSAGRKPMFL
jgi:lambda family phage minor tail protein L